MTRNADFKRRVRERMTRTGESYAAARAALLPRGTLHITNGDSTAMTLAELGIEALPWRDALHEGPVNAERALAWTDRNRILDTHTGDYVLWFEADLYAPEPNGLLASSRSRELRFMAEAFTRLAQEYPWRRDGLSLTERRLLVARGTPVERFLAANAKETRPFLGDTLAFKALDRLAPLLQDDVRREAVLAGEAQFITDRWIGGVHITPDTEWRWDEGREAIIRL